nr:hypothetical protein [Tanacetum cinerariifolium]
MVKYLYNSDTSAGFDQVVNFLNAHVIQYALMVDLTIYVSCIKQFWVTASIKKANDVVKLQTLIDGKKVVVTSDVIRQDLCLDDTDRVECLPNEEIFAELARMGYENPPPKLTFYKAFFSAQWKFLFHTLVQCVSAKRTTWNEFSCSMASAFICLATGVKTPLFASILVQPQAAEMEEEVEVPTAPTLPSPTNEPSPPLQDPIPTPSQAQAATPLSPPQEQPTDTSDSSMTLLNTLLETWKIAEIDADEKITLVDIKTQVDLGAELQGRKDDDNAASKDVNANEPIGFDDEEVSMTMTKTLIKMKAKKPRLLDEQMAKRLHDEEVAKATAREKKYQDLKKKPVLVTQASKNMIIYLKNMAGYKMECFRCMTYDKTGRLILKDQDHTRKLLVGGITEAYQSLEDMLKGFNRDDLDALWRLVKEKFSPAVPIVDKEKALWVELKRLFEPDTYDVLWKLQRYIHYPIT